MIEPTAIPELVNTTTQVTGGALIQQFVAPAVMAPACGMLLLSSTSRMNTVLGRIRAFHREELEIWRDEAAPGSRADRIRTLRLEGLQRQTERLLKRASWIRVSMLLLIASLACDLFAMLALGAQFMVGEVARGVGVALFMTGLVLFVAALATSAVEVFRIMETVLYENKRVSALTAETPTGGPQSRNAGIDGDMGEGAAL